MTETNLNLAALVGSRICHDLISPVGAITNGLELLDLAGAMQGPELELISDSVHSAAARIRFFRIAFGTAGEQGLDRAEILSVLEGFSRSARLEIDWSAPDAHPRRDVRLAFLALQCFESAMPFGGRVTVSVEDGDWTISGHADKLHADPDIWACLENGIAPGNVTPARVQFALLPILAQETGRRATFGRGEGWVTIRF